MKQLGTTAFLYPAPLPNTLKSPPRYKQLSQAWKPPPNTPQQPSTLVIQTLTTPHHLQGFFPQLEAPALAHELIFQLHTLPVDAAKAVADGDTLTVYVSTSDARESSRVPLQVQMAAVEHNVARAEGNYTKADALQKQIKDAGYRVMHIDNEDVLARKYRIRLRGIDAPESKMPYGKEAKDELVNIINGKCLKILIFDEDRYGRFVGDVYCNGIFVQESMLKKGLAWHYTDYDKRPELEKWEKEARVKKIGLWASSNPEGLLLFMIFVAITTMFLNESIYSFYYLIKRIAERCYVMMLAFNFKSF